MDCCRICGADLNGTTIAVPEMMFGTRETFIYSQCPECQSLQLDELLTPSELAKHYPDDYYSLLPRPRGVREAFAALIGRTISRHVLETPNIPGRLFTTVRRVPHILSIFKAAGVSLRSRILDVGCGSGYLLDNLHAMGFERLSGVDPYIKNDIRKPNGVVVRKAYVDAVEGEFDVIMMHHALEHVPEPRTTLAAIRSKLSSTGVCIVRTPTVSSDAFETYGKDWVQIDAPRHVAIPSRSGMATLARRCGLKVEKTIDDSQAFQFWGSEQYKRGIPLRRNNLAAPPFSASEMATFEARAQDANARSRGDQAAFIMVADH